MRLNWGAEARNSIGWPGRWREGHLRGSLLEQALTVFDKGPSG